MIHTKSLERVKELGEVYTPITACNDMLNLLDKDSFGEDVQFFEPSCGNGNFVIEILKRQLDSIRDRYSKSIAVAIALSNLWAIDICPENIDETRQRVLDFFREYLAGEVDFVGGGADTVWAIILKHTIGQHIFEADFFSSMEKDPVMAEQASHKTRAGRECFLRVGHRPMPFLFKESEAA